MTQRDRANKLEAENDTLRNEAETLRMQIEDLDTARATAELRSVQLVGTLRRQATQINDLKKALKRGS